MINYLLTEAADDFLELTFVSRNFGIIGRTIFLERMSVLSRIGHPNDAATSYAQSILQRNDWPVHDDEWGHDPSEMVEEKEEGPAFDPSVRHDNDGFIYFWTSAGGLKNWFFRPGDPDFFPSIPHGHWENRDAPKLDSYLGWVYNGSKQCDRIKRKSIVALWNDEAFRDIAAKAIDYYLTHHPHYNGWRVADPRRLPRRRNI